MLSGAAVFLAAHALTAVPLGVARWSELVSREPAQGAGLGLHGLAFHALVAAVLLVAGAGTGLLSSMVLDAIGRSTPMRVAVAAAATLMVLTARTMAHAPALFEPWFWRRGGARAALQVWVTETVGEARWTTLLWLALGAGAAAILIRQRQHLLSRPKLLAVAVLSVPLGVYWQRPARARPPPPLILVLAADSLRPDRLIGAAEHRPATPNIDVLRASGRWVDDFFVPVASTTGSWASMLTGRWPHHHGIRDLFPRASQVTLPGPTLPSLLGEHGYHTAAVADYAGESFNAVHFGFDVVDAPPRTTAPLLVEREVMLSCPLALALFNGAWGQRLFPVMQYLPTNADPSVLTQRALDRLDELRNDGRPVFMVVFYSATHVPFAAPMPAPLHSASDGYEGPSRYAYEVQDLADIARASRRPDDAEVAQVRALYDGAVHAFDTEVGVMLTELDRRGLTDRLVVITGDHGESLFEPGATTEHGKWFVGGPAANRSVLLLHGARIAPGHVDGLASGIDFAPTLLAAAGVEVPPEMTGRSLLKPIPRDRAIFAESTLWLNGGPGAQGGPIAYPSVFELLEVEPTTGALVLGRSWVDKTVTAKLRAMRQGALELLYTPTDTAPRWELYDLAADPYAEHDLSGERPDELARMRPALLEWLREDPLRWLDADERVVRRGEL